MKIKEIKVWATLIYILLNFLILCFFLFTSGNGYQSDLNQIEAIQNGYHGPMYFLMYIYLILAVLFILGSFTPLFIYLRYGREPKIDYTVNYEVDLPTDDPPAIVNALCGGVFSKKVGTPDIDGFKATIIDLIDRNYLILKDTQSDGKDSGPSDSIFLKVNSNSDLNTLWNFEAEILNFLKAYEQDDVISLDTISESLNYYKGAEFFKSTYENWVDEVTQTLAGEQLKKAFLRKGDKYLKIFGISGLIIAIVTFFIVLSFISPDLKPIARYVLMSSVILGIVAFISISMPEKIAGQWTAYGKEYYAQWHNFKKYIEDYSLMKEYSPESVKVWNRYLVYATALGAADGVKKAMELTLPESILSKTDLYMFHYYNSLSSLFTNAIKTALESD